MVRLELVLPNVCLRAIKGLSHPFGDQLVHGQDEKHNSNFLCLILNDLPFNWDRMLRIKCSLPYHNLIANQKLAGVGLGCRLAFKPKLAILCSFFILRETHGPTILRTRADPSIAGRVSLKSLGLITHSVRRSFKLLFLSPPVAALCWLIIAITLSTEYILFSTLGILYRDVHRFSASYSGLTYLGMAFGSITAALILVETGDCMSRYLTRKFGGLTRSECRRTVMIVGVPLAVIGLFFCYVWAAQAKAFWLLPILGSFIIGFGLIAVQVKYQYNLLIPTFFIHMLVNLNLLPTLPGRLL